MDFVLALKGRPWHFRLMNQIFLDSMGVCGKKNWKTIILVAPTGNPGSPAESNETFFFCLQNVCTVICIQIVSLIIVIIWPRNAVRHANSENM